MPRGAYWSEDEDRLLIENSDLPITDVVDLLPGRDYGGVLCRRSRLIRRGAIERKIQQPLDRSFTLNDLSRIGQQVIISGMFGDGSIHFDARRQHTAYRIIHGIDQRDYAEWKARQIPELSPSGPHIEHEQDHPSVMWFTRHVPFLRRLHHDFYRIEEGTRKKGWPSTEWAAKLDPLGFLLYVLDDGTRERHVRASTRIFSRRASLGEMRATASVWERRFGVTFSVTANNYDARCLNIRRDALNVLLPVWQRLFDEHGLPECMRYKIVDDPRSR